MLSEIWRNRGVSMKNERDMGILMSVNIDDSRYIEGVEAK